MTTPAEAGMELLAYCRACHWLGHDPYDALNSRLLKFFPFLDVRMARIILTQLNKRSPWNLRPLLQVPRTSNAKGTALALSATVRLSKQGLVNESEAVQMAGRLLELRSPGQRNWCWGYSFPWQTRTVLVPRNAPNLVCTCFAANALLDLFEQTGDPRWFEPAISAADYLLKELFWTEGDSVASFSYPLPLSRTKVHNANFLGAALLSRIHAKSGEERFLEPALRAVRYSVGCQHEDGSWDYGETAKQRWIDHFHTGFNLCALRQVGSFAETVEFDVALRRGLAFYLDHFFTSDHAPKYFHDRTYPLDIHSAAQAIITLIELQGFDRRCAPLADVVLRWTIQNMRDESGCFYYQKHRHWTNRISYLRWSQTWMLLALAFMLEQDDKIKSVPEEKVFLHSC